MLKPFAIKSDHIVTPHGVMAGAVWIAADGTIADITRCSDLPRELARVDAEGLWVLPGVVDTHVHINEPGRTDWEGFATATHAAAAGGVTTMVDMPLNCIPVTTTASALATKLEAIRGHLWVDCGFFGGVVPGNSSELGALEKAGVLGFKAFMADSGIPEFPALSPRDLMTAMPLIARLGVPLLAHAELEGAVAPSDFASDDYRSYLASRPKSWENAAIRILITEAGRTRCAVHVVHLSSAEALPLLAEARLGGVPITVETCPHYLTLTAEDIARGDTRFKCAPPIRESANREALWQGLSSGAIDCVVSDHSPCTPELKGLVAGDFQKAWGGISSLQLSLSLVWTEAKLRGFDLTDVARWLSSQPARLVGISDRKGRIASGLDADLVLFDPGASWTVVPEGIFHRHKITPYAGRTLTGRVAATYLRGRKIFADGAFGEGPHGAFILRGT